MDEREGVEEARRLGLTVTGTLGVLDRAAAAGWRFRPDESLDLPPLPAPAPSPTSEEIECRQLVTELIGMPADDAVMEVSIARRHSLHRSREICWPDCVIASKEDADTRTQVGWQRTSRPSTGCEVGNSLIH